MRVKFLRFACQTTDTPGIINNGTLTIADTEINATSSSSSYGIDEYTCIGNTDSGTLIIDGTTSITANINSGLYGIHNEGYLTIQGNSVITARGNDNDVFGVKNYNNCVIKDWTKITAINEGKWDCEGVENYGNLVVNDNVTITSEYYEDSHNNYGIYVNDGASLEVNGGTISGKIGISYENSTVTNYINGGTIIGEKNGIINSGTLIINNANIYTTATSMVVDDILGRTPSGIYNVGDLTINGGNISGFADGVFSMTMSTEQPSKLTVNGGTISSTVTNDFLESFLAEMGADEMLQAFMPIMPLMIGNGINSCSETSIVNCSISGLNQGAFFAGNVNISGGTFSGGNADITAGNEMFEMIMGMLIETGNLETNITITGGTMGSIDFAGNTLNLSGALVITEKIHLGENKLITINGALTGTYPVEMDTPGVFTSGANDFPDAVKHFSSFDPNYAVVANSDGELELAEVHRHDDGMEFLPWDKTDSLPTTSGSYYLTKDVHINNARYTISSDIDLCLHGHSISFELEYNSAWLYIDDGSNFNLYDDENKGKVEGTLWINHGGNAIIYGGTFDFYIAVDEGGKAVIKDGMFSKGCQLYGGDLTIDGGTIETQGVAIQLINDSSFLTINNGIIKSKGSLVIDSAALNPDNAAITINGGTITGETQNTPVIAVSDGNKLTITGGTISGSRSISSISKDFYLSGNAVIDGNIIIAVYPINIIGELTNTDPYVIYMTTPGVFATGEFAAQSADKFTPSAELASEGYTVVVTENDELAIDYRHYTYGDNGEFKLLQMKPPRPTSLDSGIAVISLPENCDLKVNGKTVTDATVIEESTNYKYIISVKISRENGFNIGENEIQGLISSDKEQTNVNDSGSYSIKVIVDPKPISAEFADDPAKTYDGNTDCEAEFTSDGILKGDDVSITAERCEFDSADVGTRKVTAYGLTITGDQKDFYKLEEDEIIGSGEITPKPLDIPESEFTYNGETVLEVELDGENGEKVTATLTAYSKNAGTYTYDVTASAGKYTAELSSTNYSIDTAGALTIDPRVAEIEWQDETTFVYDGEAKIVKAALSNKVANDDVEFEFKGNVGTKAGTYTAGVIGFIGADEGNYTLENAENKEQSWKITAADSGLTLTAENKTVTYGGSVSLTATINRTSTNGIMTMSAEPDKVDFYIGDDLIGTESVTYTDGSNGTAVLELPATSAKHFKAGENTIRAEYGGSGDLLASSGEIVIKVEPKPVTADIIGVTSKTYDGTNIITDLSLQLDGIESCDAENVKATAESYTFNSANVNEASTITANGAVLFGTQAENYKLTVNTAQGEITPAKVDIPESEFTYDGETVRKVEIDGVNNETVTATLTAYSKNAGTYAYDVTPSAGKYTAELSSTNYSIDKAGALTIDPRVAEIEWQDEISFDYDGTEKSVAAEVTNTVSGDVLNIAYKNNKAADVGEYTAEIISLGDDNYTLDGAENVTLAWEISAVGREETNVAIDYIGETLSTSDDMEYSTDGETWLPCAENMSVKAVGWNESESLTVKFRYAADKNHTAGKTQNVTIPPRPAAPDISEVTVTKTQDSITVTEIANCEYSIDGTTWQDSGTFEGLTEGTEYTVQIRTKADESEFASFAAEKTVVTSDTSSGTTDLKEGETVETDSGSITNDGKNVEIEDNDGNKTTVTLPDGASDSVEVDESGNVKVPDGSVVETGDTTVTLPDGGTVSPDGTITADKVVIDDTTVSGDEVTVTPDGNITVSENGTIQSGDTTVELPDGGTVSPDGTITADKVVIGDTTVSGNEVTVTSDGNVIVSENGTVQSGDTTVELPDGGTVSPDGTITADNVVIGDTTVSGDEVTVTPDGDITVSENGTVQSGDTTVELPDGGTVSPDGTITADKVVIGDTTVSADEVTVTPDGDITVSENGTVQNGDTTLTLPDGGTISPDGTITADNVVVGDTTVSGDEVTITPDGDITVSENGTVQNGDTTLTLPDGGTVNPDGTITADKVVIDDTTVSGDEVTVTSDGDITVSENGTVQSGDTTVELPDGGTVSPDGTITADKVVVGDTTVSGDEVTVTPDGNITVSENGTVQSGDTTVELPDGGTVKPDGTITADKVVIGDTTVSGDEVTVTSDGDITVSGNGTIQSGDTTVTGDEVTVTSDGNITVSGNGKIQDEDTIVTGETVTVDKDGNIAIPNGGTVSANGSETVIGNDGSIKNNEVSIEPVDSVDYCDENGENYSLNNGYIVLDIESADDDEIVKDLESESDISVIKAYDIKLLYNGKLEVQPNGTVKVTIAAPTGVDGTEKVLHINENGFEDMNAEYDRNSNTFSFKTDHFSIYVIAASDDDPIVPPPTSSGSTQTPPIEPEPEETTSPEETTGPEETTAPEEATAPEETTSSEETTAPEETTVPAETAKPEETTDYPTDVSGDNSENNPPTGVSPDLAVLATAAFTVAAALFLKKKRSSDK